MRRKEQLITLAVGSGGKAMRDFLKEKIATRFSALNQTKFPDAVQLINKNIGFTTDSFVVSPIFFPGGDIGKLAVAGTVNDLVVSGILPEFLSLALIIEEGFPLNDMEKILNSIQEEAKKCNVKIVTGDTKVVEKGKGDKIYINTAGIGKIIAKPDLSKIKEDAEIIINGGLGEHSIAVMLARGEFALEGTLLSDCESMIYLIDLWKKGVLWMRDITRGGLATVLSELAENLDYPVIIEEDKIPISKEVKSACELLGLDPLYLACEGRAVIICQKNISNEILSILRKNGKTNSRIIGKIASNKEINLSKKCAFLRTIANSYRLLEPLTGELLPRIC